MACCPAESSPALLSAEEQPSPRGAIEEAPPAAEICSPMRIYRVHPCPHAAASADSGTTIIVCHDIFGLEGGRTRHLCDLLADLTGCTVIMPDFYYGDDCVKSNCQPPDRQKLYAWLAGFPPAMIENAFRLQVKPYVKTPRIVSVGFCWGTWASFRLASVSECAAIVGPHPSLGVQQLFGSYGSGDEAMLDAAELVDCPVLLMPAGGDPDAVQQGGLVQKKLEGKGVKVVVESYPDMIHGWTTRGAISDANVKRSIEKAMQSAATFIKQTCA